MLATICAIILFTATTFAFGWPMTQRIKGLNAAERVTASLTLGAIILFVVSFVISISGLLDFYYLFPVFASVILLSRGKSILQTIRSRGLIAPTLITCLWGLQLLLLAATIKTHVGSGWAGDWLEHYIRSIFFLVGLPLDYSILDTYSYTARPPLGNMLATPFLQIVGINYYICQGLYLAQSLLLVWPAYLLFKHFGGKDAWSWLLLLFFLTNPMLQQNATFLWTKHASAWLVLSGLYFFVRSYQSGNQPQLRVLAFLAMAGALLAHYSAAPFLLAMLMYYFWRGIRDWNTAFLRETATHALLCGAVLVVYFGWAISTYGVEDTFLSNSAVTTNQSDFFGWLAKVSFNLYSTIVPVGLRPDSVSYWAYVSLPLCSQLHETAFMLYQTNLLLGLGAVTWVFALYFLARQARAANTDGQSQRAFWLLYMLIGIVVGVGAHGAIDTVGLAHIGLQPLMLVALVFVAARAHQLTRFWLCFLLVGLLLDAVLGVWLHFSAQAADITPWVTPMTLEQMQTMLHEAGEVAAQNRSAQNESPITYLHRVTSPMTSILLGAAYLTCVLIGIRYWWQMNRTGKLHHPS